MSESILRRIESDMVASMKSRDADTLSTLRMLKAALMEAKTRKAKDESLPPEEEIEVLQRYVKKRREAIEELRKVSREETIPREEQEIAITSRYLPPPVSEDEIRRMVLEAIERTGAAGPKDLGKVMGPVMAQVKGKADGNVVSRIVREALGGS